MEKADVWLDDSDDDEGNNSGPDVFNFAAGLQHGIANDEASGKSLF